MKKHLWTGKGGEEIKVIDERRENKEECIGDVKFEDMTAKT